MKYEVFILPSAFEDLKKAEAFYSMVRLELGQYCVDCLLADIDSLERYATIHSMNFGYYRLLSRRFPFAIYYQTVRNRVAVSAVLDTRLNPTMHITRLFAKDE